MSPIGNLFLLFLTILSAWGAESPDNSLCIGDDGQPLTIPSFGLEGVCGEFYQCSNGILTSQECAPGTVFNPQIGVCDHPYNVMGCENTAGGPGHPNPATTTAFSAAPTPTTTPFVDITSTSFSPSTSSIPNTSSTSSMSSIPNTSSSPSTSSIPNTSSSPSTSSILNTSSTSSTSSVSVTSPEETTGFSYVAFVVDDTGSMSNEIIAVKEWISNCIDGSYSSCANTPTGGWIVTSFNDPNVGPVLGPTSNVGDVINFVDHLSANGGADCPELAFKGLENAAHAVPDDNVACKVFFFTDAVAKDTSLSSDVIELYLRKGCSFIPLLTGCCGECEDPCISLDPEYCINFVVDGRDSSSARRRRSSIGYSSPPEELFYKLASDTGGNIYLTDKPANSDDLLDFLEDEVTLGFCPTEKLAGPPPLGYENEHDCNFTHQCWDRSVRKCYCVSLTSPCPDYLIILEPECPPDGSHSFLPDPTDCTMYYECANGNKWNRPCADGTVFDPAIGGCNHPYKTAPPCGTLV